MKPRFLAANPELWAVAVQAFCFKPNILIYKQYINFAYLIFVPILFSLGG